VLNQLYRLTDMQASFGIINLSIVDSRPEVLDLKQTLERFVEHRREVISRRTRFELTKAEGPAGVESVGPGHEGSSTKVELPSRRSRLVRIR